MGKLYEFISEKQTFFLNSDNSSIYHWVFKNYELDKDVQIILCGETRTIKSEQTLFLLRQRYENGRYFYDAIINGRYTIIEDQGGLKDNLIDLEEKPLIIDEQISESFVRLKNKRDMIWIYPYDKNIENTRLGITTLMSDKVFKTKKVATIYHGLRYVSLYSGEKFVGWVNESLISMCTYQQYISSINKKDPVGEELKFFDSVLSKEYIFEKEGSLYKESDIIKQREPISYNEEEIQFVDGTFKLSNGEKWIRVRSADKTLGWILGEEKSQAKVLNQVDMDKISEDFYITEKDFSGLVRPKCGEIKLFTTEKNLLNRKYEVINFSEISVFKIASYNSGKYYYVENIEISGFVSASDVEVVETQYMNELPEEIKGKIFPTDTVFVTMGRLSPEKNQMALLKATKELIQKHPNLKVLVLGKGPLEEMLKERIIDYKLQDNFFLAGQFVYPFNVIRQADFFVFPSIWEGQPMVLLETLLLGKKIVSSNLKQSVHVLKEGELGLIADGADYQALSEGMDMIMSGNHTYIPFDGYEYNQEALEQFYNYINI